MNCRCEAFRTARFIAIHLPEIFSQLNRMGKTWTTQDEINKPTGLERSSVKKPRLSRSQPHADEERQRPYMEVEVIPVRGCYVFDHVCFRQPEYACGVWAFPDLTTHEILNSLKWRIDPVLFDALASKYVTGDPLEVRERTDRDRPCLDMQRVRVESELLDKPHGRSQGASPPENPKPACSGTPAARRAASVWICGQDVTRML